VTGNEFDRSTSNPTPGTTDVEAVEALARRAMAAGAAGPDAAGITVGEDGVARCWWCGDDPLYRRYHDLEWGRPVDDDRRLFEKLCLEGFQAGLSWLTILRKRESFRRAFEDFQIEAVARFDTSSVDRLLTDAGIVRNRAKIEATINNARRCIELIDELGSLAAYVWRFEPDARSRPTVLDQPTLLQIGASPESKAMSKDLRRRGWSFVGPTTVYSFMEAMGLVNDHLDRCAFRAEVERERRAFQRPSAANRRLS
jgi:DNA-3-methyladenine glycosylase I